MNLSPVCSAMNFNNWAVIVNARPFLREIVIFDEHVWLTWQSSISTLYPQLDFIKTTSHVVQSTRRSLTLIFWAADDLIYFFEFFHDFCRAKETYVMRQIIYHKGTCRHTYIAVYGILHFFKAWAPKLVNELFSCPSFITSSHLSRSKKEEWKELYFLLFFCNAVPNVLFQ